MDSTARRLASSPHRRLTWEEIPALRTPTARVWAHREDIGRWWTTVRQGLHCFGSELDHVIDFARRASAGGWTPRCAPWPAWVSRRGEHVRLGGVDVRLLDFGVERAGAWQPMLGVDDAPLRARDIALGVGPEQSVEMVYSQRFTGRLAAGVTFTAELNEKGYSKLLKFDRAVQTEWFRRLGDADLFGFRYRIDGDHEHLTDGLRLRAPRMWVFRRGGQAYGFYRRAGDHLYALFYRTHIDRLLSGDWYVDPAITQESIQQNSDDCYDRDDTNANAITGYGNNIYLGDYAGADTFGGWRFQTIPVPQGVTLNSAFFRAYRTGGGGSVPSSLTFDCDDRDDAPTWVNGTTQERPRGTAYTATTATASWTSFGANAQYIPTGSGLNITAPVQEVVQRAGWTNNANMRMRAGNETTPNNAYVTVEDFNAASANHATLDIDYVGAGAGSFLARRSDIGALSNF